MTDLPPVAPQRVTLSAFFPGAAQVDEAVYQLGLLGVPRDLIQVAATPEVAREHYERRGRPHGRQAGRMAAVGALVGLIVGIFVSLALLVWPTELARAMAIVQLLGPNFSTVAGAVIGAIYGAFFAPRPELGVLARLRERTDALLLVVRQFPVADTEGVRELLVGCGGSDVAVAEG